MEYTDLELLILKHVRAENYRPVKPRVITKQLGLPEARRPEVRKAVKRLAKRGELAYGTNHLVTAASPQQAQRGEVVGIFQRTSAGFGFVRPRAATAPVARTSDIYIPANETSDASSGDLVRVSLRAAPPRRQ